MTNFHSCDLSRNDARTRLLEAARDLIRAQGFCATTVDNICRKAGVTKGAFFHHFENKEALGVAAVIHWSETTSELFADASYHACHDPLDRLLEYIAYRKRIIEGDPAEFSCLAGALAQEVYGSHPAIRESCAASIFAHAETLEPDIEAAMAAHRISSNMSPAGVAAHIQAVLQGAFVLAKAADDPEIARASLDHLACYIEMLFGRSPANAIQ
ncbi:TetR/AcrR family transcriptional regulator [Qipengyuania sp. 6B39]|uniref:TetR/AcrR family transcriptional regulator n=1 Tax=Qipengyuania proteolytica TaxID=2867239 RepID=UPI001C8AA2DB|nr:TetR/AcrR family transcriptional regulator [Qipengyuania proteolytica]MBX7494299.1 TetR/AcrR family transcriptional regulator [Qipengyuania proteolytica]